MPVRISAVVPAYNAARTVAATLDSLLAQSSPPCEIVVVDDGSRDDTRTALEPYADRAKLVFQANGGVSAARNRAVQEASGDWLAFCDADDLWHADKLRVVAAAIDAAPDVDLVFHDFWTFDGDRVVEERATHSAGTMFPLFKEVDISIPRILDQRRRIETGSAAFPVVDAWFGHALRWLMVGNFLMPSTVLVRRSAFLACGGFDANFRYAEDTEFFLRYAKATPFLWIDAALTGYRRAPGTLLTGNMLPTILNATRAVEAHCIGDRAVVESDPKWVTSAVARRFSRLAYYCLSELLIPEARQHARTSLRYDRWNRRAWKVALATLLPVSLLRLARSMKTAR